MQQRILSLLGVDCFRHFLLMPTFGETDFLFCRLEITYVEFKARECSRSLSKGSLDQQKAKKRSQLMPIGMTPLKIF
eukprot:c27162_g3_i1 orf=348-578(+)